MSAASGSPVGAPEARTADAHAVNESVVRRIFAAFTRRDAFALRGLFAPDAVWTVPGGAAQIEELRVRWKAFPTSYSPAPKI